MKHRPADCAGPPPIWVHVRNRVSGQPALDEIHPVAAPVRSCAPFFSVSGDLLGVRMEMGGWATARRRVQHQHQFSQKSQQRRWACDSMARRSTCSPGISSMKQSGDTTFAHLPTHALLSCFHIAFSVHCLRCVIPHWCSDPRHAQGSVSCLPHVSTPLHDTASHPLYTDRSRLLCLCLRLACLH